jgi:hypothetical protein
LQKRQRLEEVKPRARRQLPAVDCDTEIAWSTIALQDKRLPRPEVSLRLLETAYSSWVLGLVGEVGIVKHGMKRESFWLRHVLDHSSPLPILRQSLVALAFTGHGKTRRDAIVLEHGHRLYGRVLQDLKRMLSHPVMVYHEDVLATAGLMVLYEVCSLVEYGELSDPNHV